MASNNFGPSKHTEIGYSRCSRLRECCKQAGAEVISNSSNEIHQTWSTYFGRSLYTNEFVFVRMAQASPTPSRRSWRLTKERTTSDKCPRSHSIRYFSKADLVGVLGALSQPSTSLSQILREISVSPLNNGINHRGSPLYLFDKNTRLLSLASYTGKIP